MATFSVCYNCPKRLVTSEYNCHDHCERYIAEVETAAYMQKLKETENNLYGQSDQAIQKACKKRRDL